MTDQTSTDDEDKGKGGEAARYRVRLRQAEAERDALAARVAAFTQADVERHVATRLADAEDLFVLGGVGVPDLVDEDGAIDVTAIDAAGDSLLEKRPRLALGWEPDTDGFDGGARQSTSGGSGASWAAVLNGAGR